MGIRYLKTVVSDLSVFEADPTIHEPGTVDEKYGMLAPVIHHLFAAIDITQTEAPKWVVSTTALHRAITKLFIDGTENIPTTQKIFDSAGEYTLHPISYGRFSFTKCKVGRNSQKLHCVLTFRMSDETIHVVIMDIHENSQ